MTTLYIINDKSTNVCSVPDVLQTEQHDCSLAGVLSLSFIREASVLKLVTVLLFTTSARFKGNLNVFRNNTDDYGAN